MPKFYGAIDLVKNELQNAVIQNLGSAPASPTKGQMYFNSTDNTLYWFNGTSWIPAMDIGGGGAPTGPAGGDLGGTYPNPTVVKASGDFTVPAGYILLTKAGGGLNGAAIRFGSVNAVSLYEDAPGGQGRLVTSGQMKAVGFDAQNAKVVNVLDPTTPQDAATKSYVDNALVGLTWKSPCVVATTANIVLSGPQTIDGRATVAGERVLVKNQTDQTQNGVYLCAAGAWTRVTDMDTGNELIQAAVFVESGTSQHDTGWTQTTDPPISIGTTALVWTQFSGGQMPTAGGGLTLTGSTLDVGAGNGILVAADSVAVDPAIVALKTDLTTVARKYVMGLNGTGSPEVFTHNLGTRDISLTVYNAVSPYRAVEVDWEATSVNSATVYYNPALGAGYRVVILG